MASPKIYQTNDKKNLKIKLRIFFDEIDIKTPDPTSCLTRV